MFKRTDYIRDPLTGALLRKDKNALNQHRIRKKEYQRIEETENEIHSLKKEISELKEMLMDIKGINK